MYPYVILLIFAGHLQLLLLEEEIKDEKDAPQAADDTKVCDSTYDVITDSM